MDISTESVCTKLGGMSPSFRYWTFSTHHKFLLTFPLRLLSPLTLYNTLFAFLSPVSVHTIFSHSLYPVLSLSVPLTLTEINRSLPAVRVSVYLRPHNDRCLRAQSERYLSASLWEAQEVVMVWWRWGNSPHSLIIPLHLTEPFFFFLSRSVLKRGEEYEQLEGKEIWWRKERIWGKKTVVYAHCSYLPVSVFELWDVLCDTGVVSCIFKLSQDNM